MTKRETNLRIFEKRDVPNILFQPRIENWYNWNKEQRYEGSTLPERYRNMSLLEVYDDLDISIRYIYGYWPWEGGVYSKEIKIKEETKGGKKDTIISTPQGELVEEKRLASNGSWQITKHLIKSAEDVEKAIRLSEHATYAFNQENFDKGNKYFGNRGEPQFYMPRSGYQKLCIDWMGMENLMYALNDFPKKIERLMQTIDNSYDILYESIISCGKVRIINFGENIDANIVPPYYLEKYCIPFYEKRVRQLQKAGIYTHIHIDGSLKPLLKYLKELPFDGIEALTPLPQGDVTFEEIKEWIGDKIVLDGIPAIFFLPNSPLEELQKCVEKLVKLFYPRLILGASDDVPPPADIERVRYISEYCQKLEKQVKVVEK